MTKFENVGAIAKIVTLTLLPICTAYLVFALVYPKQQTPVYPSADAQACEKAIYILIEDKADCVDRLEMYKDVANDCEDLLKECRSGG